MESYCLQSACIMNHLTQRNMIIFQNAQLLKDNCIFDHSFLSHPLVLYLWKSLPFSQWWALLSSQMNDFTSQHQLISRKKSTVLIDAPVKCVTIMGSKGWMRSFQRYTCLCWWNACLNREVKCYGSDYESLKARELGFGTGNFWLSSQDKQWNLGVGVE